MKFPLIGADTREEFEAASEWTGAFADPFKRKAIFAKPRKYRVEIHIRVEGAWEISTLTLPYDKIDKSQLAQILYEHAVRDVRELLGTGDVYTDQSFFKICVEE